MRLFYLIARNLFVLPRMMFKMRKLSKSETYSEQRNYQYLRRIVARMKRTGNIRNQVLCIRKFISLNQFFMMSIKI